MCVSVSVPYLCVVCVPVHISESPRTHPRTHAHDANRLTHHTTPPNNNPPPPQTGLVPGGADDPHHPQGQAHGADGRALEHGGKRIQGLRISVDRGLFTHPSIHPSVYLSRPYPSTHLSIYRPIRLSIHPPTNNNTHTYPPIHPPIQLTNQPTLQQDGLPTHPSNHPPTTYIYTRTQPPTPFNDRTGCPCTWTSSTRSTGRRRMASRRAR